MNGDAFDVVIVGAGPAGCALERRWRDAPFRARRAFDARQACRNTSVDAAAEIAAQVA